jgi:hypothetical protein
MFCIFIELFELSEVSWWCAVLPKKGGKGEKSAGPSLRGGLLRIVLLDVLGPVARLWMRRENRNSGTFSSAFECLTLNRFSFYMPPIFYVRLLAGI